VLRLDQTKNGERRSVPMPQRTLDVFQAWHATRRPGIAWVFPGVTGLRPMKVDGAWHAARRRAGLDDFRFHDLRHTAASYLAMSGASLLDIAEILGHKTLAMVKRYAHLSPAHTAGVIQHMADMFLQDERSP
jgi:integrase